MLLHVTIGFNPSHCNLQTLAFERMTCTSYDIHQGPKA